MNEVTKTLNNYIKENKVNHSYLIETNYKDRKEIANQVVDNIIKKVGINKSKHEIETDGDLIYLHTDNQNIKKEEIINIKEQFKTTSVNSGIRIYVILETEKLNSSSANTLLKFLEEPNDNIYAVLITDNKNKVITTIVSRCQCLNIKNEDNIFNEKDKDYLDMLFKFVDMIESKKEKTLAYINTIIPEEYIEREKIKEIFTDLFYIYDLILHKKYVKVNLDNYEETIEKLVRKCNYEDVSRKMIKIDENINRLRYNTNLKLSIYNLIIDLSGVDINV